MKITMVQKVKHNGQPCAKSARVLSELETLELRDRIDHLVTADERNPDSEGFALAAQYSVDAAPFSLWKVLTGLPVSIRRINGF